MADLQTRQGGQHRLQVHIEDLRHATFELPVGQPHLSAVELLLPVVEDDKHLGICARARLVPGRHGDCVGVTWDIEIIVIINKAFPSVY